LGQAQKNSCRKLKITQYIPDNFYSLSDSTLRYRNLLLPYGSSHGRKFENLRPFGLQFLTKFPLCVMGFAQVFNFDPGERVKSRYKEAKFEDTHQRE
jgi:hypothetical protein